jgi:glycosyltransferase involved in cell wall biosynthesis
MRVLFDGLPITGSSLAIVVQHLLAGWREFQPDDELHIVLGPGAELSIPEGVTVHPTRFGRSAAFSRVRHQTFTVPRLARRIGADVVFGVLPTTTMAPLPCPRVIMAYDIRHELRPEQFSRANLIQRRFSYRWGQADGIACISGRTRTDLLASRPWLADRPVVVTHLGADHVDSWQRPADAGEYALAFGQYGNKNVDLVLDAWALLHASGDARPLRLVGLNGESRQAVTTRVHELGLDGVVAPSPWLSEQDFRHVFAGAGLVVFPSDFEGFGLPAVEAMRLGIPVAITPDPALLEVTSGHAAVMDGWDAPALADAVRRASAFTPADTAAARLHAAPFTWAHTAAGVRQLITDVKAS